MARKNKKEYVNFSIGKEWEVSNVRELKHGTFFALRLPGLSLYNLRVVPAGKSYDAFIAMPQEKGKDGNYYDQYKIWFDEDEQAEIIEAVEKALTK